jgi:hypothetical protein
MHAAQILHFEFLAPEGGGQRCFDADLKSNTIAGIRRQNRQRIV